MDRSDDPAWMGQPETTPHSRNGRSAEIRTVAEVPPLTPPPYVPPTPALTEDVAPTEMFSAQQMAARFHKAVGGAYLGSILEPAMPGVGDAEVMRHYLHMLTVDSNAQNRPIQEMMLQQITFTHHRIASLLVNSANARSPELVALYSAAAARMMTEWRKLVLAFDELQSVSTCDATFRKITRTQTHPSPPIHDKVVTELVSNKAQKSLGDKLNGTQQPAADSRKERKSSSGRSGKSPEASGTHTVGKAEAAGCDFDSQTVVAGKGSQYSRW